MGIPDEGARARILEKMVQGAVAHRALRERKTGRSPHGARWRRNGGGTERTRWRRFRRVSGLAAGGRRRAPPRAAHGQWRPRGGIAARHPHLMLSACAPLSCRWPAPDAIGVALSFLCLRFHGGCPWCSARPPACRLFFLLVFHVGPELGSRLLVRGAWPPLGPLGVLAVSVFIVMRRFFSRTLWACERRGSMLSGGSFPGGEKNKKGREADWRRNSRLHSASVPLAGRVEA